MKKSSVKKGARSAHQSSIDQTPFKNTQHLMPSKSKSTIGISQNESAVVENSFESKDFTPIRYFKPTTVLPH